MIAIGSFFACSASKKRQILMEKYTQMYRNEFVSQTFYRFLDDKKWKDRVNCFGSPNDFSPSDWAQIYMLVDSVGIVLNSDIAKVTNGLGSLITHEVAGYCVGKECMKICNSKPFKVLSKQYALSKIKSQNIK